MKCKVELLEPPAEAEASPVIVTRIRASGHVDLRQREIDEAQAADLRRWWPVWRGLGSPGDGSLR